MVMNMSDENKISNENIGVGAGGADVGSNPTPRTTFYRYLQNSDGRAAACLGNLVVCDMGIYARCQFYRVIELNRQSNLRPLECSQAC